MYTSLRVHIGTLKSADMKKFIFKADQTDYMSWMKQTDARISSGVMARFQPDRILISS